jgi:hypothetical protein
MVEKMHMLKPLYQTALVATAAFTLNVNKTAENGVGRSFTNFKLYVRSTPLIQKFSMHLLTEVSPS